MVNIDLTAYWSSVPSGDFPRTDLRTFGYSNTPNYGQTIKTPDGSNVKLSSFSFEVDLASTCTFKLYIYEFNTGTGQVTGSALYTSGDLNTAGGGYELVTVSPNLTLDSSKTYIVLASIYGLGGSGSGRFGALFYDDGGGDWVDSSPDKYTDGNLWYSNSTSAIASITFSGGFNTAQDDLVFKATFDTVGGTTDNSLFFSIY